MSFQFALLSSESWMCPSAQWDVQLRLCSKGEYSTHEFIELTLFWVYTRACDDFKRLCRTVPYFFYKYSPGRNCRISFKRIWLRLKPRTLISEPIYVASNVPVAGLFWRKTFCFTKSTFLSMLLVTEYVFRENISNVGPENLVSLYKILQSHTAIPTWWVL